MSDGDYAAYFAGLTARIDPLRGGDADPEAAAALDVLLDLVVPRLIAERDAERAKVKAVRALHQREQAQRQTGHGDNAEGIWLCAGCLTEHPCATTRALDEAMP